MKKYNKFIAGIMAVCFMCGVGVIPESIIPAVSVTANAEEEYTYENLKYRLKYQQTGETSIEITGCDESATEVFIPDYINNYKVTHISSFAFSSCHDLSSVIIGENVEEIGVGAFTNCFNLETINVALNNQNFTSYMNVLFNKDKTHLLRVPPKSYHTRYTVPDTVTHIDYRAFDTCSKLTSVTISDSVTTINPWAFHNCKNLALLEMSRNVKSIGMCAFYDCKGIQSVTIPASVETVGKSAFDNCINLKSVKFVDGVSNIGESAFGFNFELTSVEIPASVTEIKKDAFIKCTGLSKVTILNPDCKIGDSSSTFSNKYDSENSRYSFDGIIRGYKNSTAQEYAEKYGYEFESIEEVPEDNTPTLEIIKSGTFMDLNWTLDNEGVLRLIGKGDMYDLMGTNMQPGWYGYRSMINECIIEDGITSIGNWVFHGCNKLTKVTIPDSVKSIGSSAFWRCESLADVTIPENVGRIGVNAFTECENLTKITILNPECEIYSGEKTINNTAVIYGYKNSTAQAYAEKYERKFVALDGEENTATGDLNGDGDFNVSDLVTIQKYISGVSDTEISDWKQADLYPDGVLDIFDLVMMRKKLIEK